MKTMLLGLLVSAFAISCSAPEPGYRPAFDPSQFKGPQQGAQNQVLVLGTAHLSALPDTFNANQLEPLIDRLALWEPQIITIEAVSGPQCAYMRSHPARYAESVEYYCWDPAPAFAATGLDVAEATAEIGQVLAAWPESPNAAERRYLAALFLAGGDRTSALVQWLQLPLNERRTGDNLDDALVAELNKLLEVQSENYLIAAPLAARLGLERVYMIDDHTADSPDENKGAVGKAMMKLWDNKATDERMARSEALEANLGSPDGLLDMYRSYNASSEGELVFRSDFGAALEDTSAEAYGRSYLTYWETRNLRMTANIREVYDKRSGSRGLVIVGASHKAYIESYLNLMHDMRVVDTQKLLR